MAHPSEVDMTQSNIVKVSSSKDLPPFELAIPRLDSNGIHNISLFSQDLGVILGLAVDVAENLQGLLLATLLVAITGRFGKTKNHDDDGKGEKHLTSNGQSPSNLATDEAHTVVEEVTAKR